MKSKFRPSLSSRLYTTSIEFLLKKLTSRVLPAGSEEWRYVQCSFSQFGEDLLVLAALQDAGLKRPSYYVDVGAFDPVVFSNTLRFSKMGWRGINIDPNPVHIEKFLTLRPLDKNLQMAVAAVPGRRDFLLYSKTSDPTGRLVADDDQLSLLKHPPESKMQVEALPLATILDRYLPEDSTFGFLNIDCEGFDLEVLKTNDWSRYRPGAIAVEDHSLVQKSEIGDFCTAQGYRLFAQTYITKIFLKNQ